MTLPASPPREAISHHPRRTRAAYLDALRAVATCAVVVIHVSSRAANHPRGLRWGLLNFLVVGSTWAVPVFVMISGALLLDPSRKEAPSEFYRRRLARLGAPLVFWSIFYLAWRRFFEHENLSLPMALRELTFGRPYHHLYFLFLIAGLYMITPLLRTYVQAESPRRQSGAAMIALGWTASAASLAVIFRQHNDPLALSLFTSCVGYYLMGHVIAAGMAPRALYRWGFAIFLAALFVAIAGTSASHHFGADDRFRPLFAVYTGPTVMLMSIGLFTAFANRAHTNPEDHRPLPALVNWISAASFGIYLCHPAIMGLLQRRHVSYTWPSVWVGIPLWVAAVLGISLVVTACAKKIPGLRAVFG